MLYSNKNSLRKVKIYTKDKCVMSLTEMLLLYVEVHIIFFCWCINETPYESKALLLAKLEEFLADPNNHKDLVIRSSAKK